MGKLNFFRNIKSVRLKIILCFVSIIAILWVYAASSYFATQTLVKETEQLIEQDLKILNAEQSLAQSINARMAAARGYVLTGDPSHKALFSGYSESAYNVQLELQAFEGFQDVEEAVNRAISWRTYIQEQVFTAYDAGDTALATERLTSTDAEVAQIQELYDVAALAKAAQIETEGQARLDKMNSTKWQLMVISYLITFVAPFV